MADKKTIQYLWSPVAQIHKTLQGWKHQRKFLELNADDRQKYLSACARLILVDDQAAMFVRDQVSNTLSREMADEIYRDLAATVFNQAMDYTGTGTSLLAVDFAVQYIEREMARDQAGAAGLVNLLPDLLHKAVMEREFQMGFTCPGTPFKDWRPEDKERMIKPLVGLIWIGMSRKEGAEHEATVAAAHDALIRTFHYMQKNSHQLEEDVRLAVGERVFDLARMPDEDVDSAKRPKHLCFGMLSVPPASIPFLFAYIEKAVANGAEVEAVFARLDPRLRVTLMEAWTEQQEEAAAGDHRSTD